MPDKLYFPELTAIIKVDQLPEQLGFIQDVLENLLENFFYNESQFIKGAHNEYGYYNLNLLCPRKLGFDIPGTELSFIINPSHSGGSEFSEVNVVVESSWPILHYIKKFNQDSFSFEPSSFFKLIENIFRISDKQLILFGINVFEIDGSPFINFVDKINTSYNLSGADIIPYPASINDEEKADEIEKAIKNSGILSSQNINVYDIIFVVYIQDIELESCFERINVLFYNFLQESIIDHLKKLFVPDIKAILNLECAIVFPRKYLTPLDSNGDIIQDETIKTQLLFDIGTFQFTTSQGIGFIGDPTFSLNYPSQIGKTGLSVAFTDMKLDLSRTRNIPEATAAGFANDFVGAYVGNASITLPQKWFKNQGGATAEIYGTNLLLGTGGISGKIGLRATEAYVEPPPVDEEGNVIPPTLAFKIGAKEAVGEVPAKPGLEIGFRSFDMTFQQNAITNSNIAGYLILPPLFKKEKEEGVPDTTPAEPVRIDIEAHFNNDGDFNITASIKPGLRAEIKNVLVLTINEVEVGREDDRFYLEIIGLLEITNEKLASYFKDGIEFKKLKVWDDGKIEIVGGGTLVLPEAKTLKIGPVKLSITAIHIGTHEQAYSYIAA